MCDVGLCEVLVLVMDVAYGINYISFYLLRIGGLKTSSVLFNFETFRLVEEGFAMEFDFVWVTILTAWFWRIEVLWGQDLLKNPM